MNFHSEAGYHPYRPAAWLRVTGSDAPGFLQGQFSQDVSRLKPFESAYGLWLDAKGRILADSFILRGSGDEHWVGSYFSAAAALRARLEAFIIADDVTVEDLGAGWTAISLLGTFSRARVDGLADRPGLVFPGRRGGPNDWEWVFPQSHAGAALAALEGLPERSASEMERRRIAAGLPAVPADAGPRDLPAEAGLEDAVSHDKGCYVGQEVMARLKTRGRVRRRLRRVVGDGAAPAVPAGVWQGTAAAGELRSAISTGSAGWMGLAMLTLAVLKPGEPLALEPGGAPALRILGEPGV